MELLIQAEESGHLPLNFALETAPALRVRLHQVQGFPPASFALRPIPLLEAEPQGKTDWPEKAPTLYLHGPSYLKDGSWVPLVEQTVDLSENLFNAILLAHLEMREIPKLGNPPDGASYAAAMNRRANEILRAVPAEYRLQAYLHALADLGSHALSTANQLERSARRHRSRGTDLCLHLHRRVSLFGLWDQIFGGALYLGRYFEPAQGDALTGKWVDTGIGLEQEDKELFLDAIFLGFWSGERLEDLGSRYCPEPG